MALIAGGTGTEHLLIGRVFVGMATGICGATLPLYLGEITPVAVRGFLSGFQGIYEILGTLLVYGFGIILSFRMLAIV